VLDIGELQQPVRTGTTRFFGTGSRVYIGWAASAIKPGRQSLNRRASPPQGQAKCRFPGPNELPEDIRLRGPKATTFPLTQGWKVDSEAVELDDMTIKHITYLFTQRMFKPPLDTQRNWTRRLDQIKIPWTKVWSIKTFYATLGTK